MVGDSPGTGVVSTSSTAASVPSSLASMSSAAPVVAVLGEGGGGGGGTVLLNSDGEGLGGLEDDDACRTVGEVEEDEDTAGILRGVGRMKAVASSGRRRTRRRRRLGRG